MLLSDSFFGWCISCYDIYISISIYVYIYNYLLIYLSIYLSIYLPIYLSIYLPISHNKDISKQKKSLSACINISGKPFRNKHATFKEKYLKFIFVNSRSEDCVQHRGVYSVFRLRIYSGFITWSAEPDS